MKGTTRVDSEQMDKIDGSAGPAELEYYDIRIVDGKRQFGCKGCHKSFGRRSDLARHVRIHTGSRPFECTVCGRDFIQNSALAVHMRQHTGERPYACRFDGCPRTFGDSSSLARHMRTHEHGGMYKCEYTDCDREYTRRTSLTQHIRDKHDAEYMPPEASVTRRYFQLMRSGSGTDLSMSIPSNETLSDSLSRDQSWSSLSTPTPKRSMSGLELRIPASSVSDSDADQSWSSAEDYDSAATATDYNSTADSAFLDELVARSGSIWSPRSKSSDASFSSDASIASFISDWSPGLGSSDTLSDPSYSSLSLYSDSTVSSLFDGKFIDPSLLPGMAPQDQAAVLPPSSPSSYVSNLSHQQFEQVLGSPITSPIKAPIPRKVCRRAQLRAMRGSGSSQHRKQHDVSFTERLLAEVGLVASPEPLVPEPQMLSEQELGELTQWFQVNLLAGNLLIGPGNQNQKTGLGL